MIANVEPASPYFKPLLDHIEGGFAPARRRVAGEFNASITND